jgi:hypothetical protein
MSAPSATGKPRAQFDATKKVSLAKQKNHTV